MSTTEQYNISEERSRGERFLLRAKSSLPILKRSWKSLNKHITNGDRASVEKWFFKRPYATSKINNIPRTVVSPICVAAESGDKGIFDLLLEKGFSPFEEDRRKDKIDTTPHRQPFHLAAYRGHLDLVRELLEVHKVEVNSYGSGNTGLHWAILGRHEDVVKYLLSKRADPNIADQMEKDILSVMKGSPNYHYWYEECYPLGKAFNRGLKDMARTLIDAGADINKVRISGETMISNFVSDVGVRDIVQMVFEKGAYAPVRDLYEYVCRATFEKQEDLILPVWQFLLDMNISVRHLTNVPPDYTAPYKYDPTKPNILELMSSDALFTENVTLAEIVVRSSSDSDKDWSFKGFKWLYKICEDFSKKPYSGISSLKYLCCLRVRTYMGIVSVGRVDVLPVDVTLKRLIRMSPSAVSVRA
ncbi:receptor-interacting serine/threonine-protein kinase 4-like [Haliotis rufescens]|uniref:receptor-interacting serine/threonine-protein kinase 4-like n=1 Tax=Haliotis rufescens TaxID=6454 RepID=UPI00201E8B9B|nr:receptor-interacting serine/threonine-protein kinase 4-like [Haliotis rufescens]